MSLGKKIVFLFLVLGIGFSAGTFAALNLKLLPTFEDFETKSTTAALSRVSQVLEADLRALEVMNLEYSSWNHTYDYAQGRRLEYVEENLTPENWQSIEVHMMLVIDAKGVLLHGGIVNPFSGESLLVENEILESLGPGHPLVAHEDVDHKISGLLRTRLGIMQVVANPILTSDGKGPVMGSFVLGQYLTPQRLKEIGERATAALTLHTIYTHDRPMEAEALLAAPAGTMPPWLVSNSEETASGFLSYSDIYDAPIAVVETNAPRSITAMGSKTIWSSTVMLMAACAIFLLTAWLFMRQLIVVPLQKLTRRILDIRRTGNLEFAVDSKRKDEIGVLAGEFGQMTEQLAKAQVKLEGARDEALESSRSKSEFLARMSHEIRTPMNGVIGMTELLSDTPLTHKQKRFADTIYSSANTLLNIINDILDFSKMEAHKMQLDLIDVNLRIVVEETLDSLAGHAHRKGIELVSKMAPDLNLVVLADPLRLRQVLTNLIGNAIKFTEEGEVVVELTSVETDIGNYEVEFRIRDTGIGIKLDKQTEIFDSFSQEDGSTTRMFGGTGLGLAICRSLVSLMGSDLSVSSTPGIGSEFSFKLVLQPGKDGHSPTHKQMHSLAGKRVLVVDDNNTNLEILEHQLRSWRAQVTCASNAEQAYEFLELAQNTDVPFALAILDMQMPVKDGLQLAREIRSNNKLNTLKLVILSSVATPASEIILQELDILGQLMKPVRQDLLYHALTMVMGGSKTMRNHHTLNFTATQRLSGRVLLAEDNEVNQAVAVCMLENLGLQVELAQNGKEAVQKAFKSDFDVVLMDCQMPVLDGFQASQLIRERETAQEHTRMPIIAVTANALQGDRELCLTAGMDEYLSKPFTGEQLHAVLAQFLTAPVEPSQPLANCPTQVEGPHTQPAEIENGYPLDEEILENLASLQQPGAPSILHRVIDIYLQTSVAIKNQLASALESLSATSVSESAHALKSSSMNVGALRLAGLCQQLEIMGRDNNLNDGPALIEQLESEYLCATNALQNKVRIAT